MDAQVPVVVEDVQVAAKARRRTYTAEAPVVEPLPVELAELGVTVAVGVLLQILQVQQLERDAGLVPLGVQEPAVRHGPMVRGWRRRPVQAGLERRVAERFDRSERAHV